MNAQMLNTSAPSDEFLVCEEQLHRARDRLICKNEVVGKYKVSFTEILFYFVKLRFRLLPPVILTNHLP